MTFANGALYIADLGESRVFKVDGTGTITVVAGSGFSDSRGGVLNGDGGPAIYADLVGPSGVAVDGYGNVYIVTSEGVRMVDTSGIITTLGTGCDNGPIAVNQAGTLLYCVPGNGNPRNVVYAFNLSTQTATTFAGGGSFVADGVAPTTELLTNVQGLALDGAGNLYIADLGTNSPGYIFKVSGGLIAHIAGGGSGYVDGSLATSVQIAPVDVALDSASNIFLTTYYGLVYRIDATAQTISKFAGGGSCPNPPYINDGGPALDSCLNAVGVAVDTSDNVYVSDWYPPNGQGNHLVRQISPAFPNIIETYVGNLIPAGVTAFGSEAGGYPYFSGDGYAARDARIGADPSSLAIDPSGNLFIGDLQNNAIRRVDATTGVITTITPLPNSADQAFTGVASYFLAAGPDGTLYVNDSQRYIESIVGTTNTYIGGGGSAYSPDGTPVPTANIGSPRGIAVDGAGNLYFADAQFCTIRKISGGILGTVAGIPGTCAIGGDAGPAASATLGNPADLASDASGNLWVNDSGNLRRITADRTLITTVLPCCGLNALGTDIHGNALVALAGGGIQSTCFTGCLVQVAPTGSTTILAGNAATGADFDTPDGSPALGAYLGNGIGDIAADANGQIFFVVRNGSGGALVRRLDSENAPTTTAASGATAIFSPGSQNVTLTASVTSGSTVSGGAVTFTVTGIGSATSGTVSGGSASAILAVPAGTRAGSYAIQAVYSGVAGFASSSDTTQSLTIQAATPIVTWAAPAAITFGSALGPTQLSATANVPGTFVYNPAAGTVLSVGNNQPLSAAFTPTDSTDYTAAAANVSINVNPAPPTGTPQLTLTRTLSRNQSNNVVALVSIANTGSAAASNVMLTTAKIGTTNTSTTTPLSVGVIAAGSSAQVTLNFPGSVGSSGAATTMGLSGTYAGSSFSNTARITLP